MAVLLTGAAGFVGMNLLERLLANGHSVIAFSNTDLPPGAGRLVGFHRCVVLRGDVRDKERVEHCFREYGIDRVIHAAAVTSGMMRERDAGDDVIATNMTGTATVAAAAARHGVSRFLLVGSIAVYGTIEAPSSAAAARHELLTEEMPHTPVTLYDISKSAAEGIVGRIASLNGMSWVVGRLGTVFGPWENQTGYRDTLSPIHQLNEIAAVQGHARLPAPTVTNWHYSRDAAEALSTLLMAPHPCHHVYNLGPALGWPLSDWCNQLARRFPGFTYSIGGSQGTPVDVYDVEAYPLLSWQRFTAEFGATARFGPQEAFEDYPTKDFK